MSGGAPETWGDLVGEARELLDQAIRLVHEDFVPFEDEERVLVALWASAKAARLMAEAAREADGARALRLKATALSLVRDGADAVA